jgi:hypothetical protein
MLKSSSPRRVRLRRATVGLAALAVPVGFVALAGAPANAFAPNGGTEVINEDTNFTGILANGLVNGQWGHEGASKSGPTVFSMGLDGGTGTPDDSTIAAALAAIGPDATIDNLRVAFVLTSPGHDGVNEQPSVSDGEAVGQAFTWFGDSGLGGKINGNNTTTDSGVTISTQSQFDAWFAAGQHPQFYDDQLKLHDGDIGGTPPVSTTPLGTSILNTWPDGTHVSEVFYVSAGLNGQNENTVKQGPGGRPRWPGWSSPSTSCRSTTRRTPWPDSRTATTRSAPPPSTPTTPQVCRRSGPPRR